MGRWGKMRWRFSSSQNAWNRASSARAALSGHTEVMPGTARSQSARLMMMRMSVKLITPSLRRDSRWAARPPLRLRPLGVQSWSGSATRSPSVRCRESPSL